jgi:hypothetical protein
MVIGTNWIGSCKCNYHTTAQSYLLGSSHYLSNNLSFQLFNWISSILSYSQSFLSKCSILNMNTCSLYSCRKQDIIILKLKKSWNDKKKTKKTPKQIKHKIQKQTNIQTNVFAKDNVSSYITLVSVNVVMGLDIVRLSFSIAVIKTLHLRKTFVCRWFL